MLSSYHPHSQKSSVAVIASSYKQMFWQISVGVMAERSLRIIIADMRKGEPMSILIDVPQVAYRTIALEYVIKDKDGKRDWLAEREAEEILKNSLSDVRYSADHDHVR